MKLLLKKNETSVIAHVFIQDASSSVGGGLTGLAYNTGSLVAYYVKPGGTLTAITLQDITTLGTYEAPTSSAHMRFKLLHNTNVPGLYELHLHTDTLATNNQIVIMMRGATNMAPLLLEIQLTDLDLNTVLTQDAFIVPVGYVGDYRLEETVHFAFSTLATLSLPGGAGNGIRVFKDDGDTQLTTAQATLDAVDGETNLFQVSIVLGAANYDVDSDYQVVLSGATIGGATVTAIVATFSIQNRYQAPVHRLVSK